MTDISSKENLQDEEVKSQWKSKFPAMNS
jgi:hypothetical protein